MFRLLVIYLKPVLPVLAEKAETFLNDEFNWESLQTLLTGHAINKFKPMMQRVEMEKIDAMVDDSKESFAP